MSYGLIDYNTLKEIGNSIREKCNAPEASYYPCDMAQAIRTIPSTIGGFEEPVMLSLSALKFNNTDNSRYDFGNCIGFEFQNRCPIEQPSFRILGYDLWKGASPSEVTCYSYYGRNERLIATNGKFIGKTDPGVFIDNGSTNSIRINGETIQPVIGDVAVNYSNEYLQWTDNLYNYSNDNYYTGWRSLPVERYNNTGTPYESANNVYYTKYGFIYGFKYDESFTDNQFSFLEMSNMFASASLYSYLGPAFSGKYTRYMINTYSQCRGIIDAACGDRVENMANCYYDCTNLINAACGPNVINMQNAYHSCYNIKIANIGVNVVNGYQAYYYCSNAITVQGNPISLEYGADMFSHCYSLRDIPDFLSLKNAYNMFHSCMSLSRLPECPSLINGTSMFKEIRILSKENIQNFLDSAENLKDMTTMFEFGEASEFVNLLELNIPEHVESINGLYSGNSLYQENMGEYIATKDWVPNTAQCPDTVKYIADLYKEKTQIIYPACGNNVIDMSNAYNGCPLIENPVCGPNVRIMDYTYWGCYNIIEPVCGDNVTSMYYTYAYCNNIVEPVCGNNVEFLVGTYTNCTNITTAVCGENVDNMFRAYSNCFNLTEAVCGENVKNMQHTYYNCINLTDAVCGFNVVNMSGAYENCNNLINAVCGEQVKNMARAFQYCNNLVNAACSNSVETMDWAYAYCNSLTDAVCGINVTSMMYAYYYCKNLVNAYIGPKVSSADQAFCGCSNLKNVVSDGNIIGGPFLFAYNIENVVLGPNAVNIANAFNNQRHLNIITLPENIFNLRYAFQNCINLSSDIVIGANCTDIRNAFYGCNKIQNIYIDGVLFGSYTSYDSIINAFYRSNYTLRRNIVVQDYEGWQKLVDFNAAGNFAKTTEEFIDNPVLVNVNGVQYDTVRCAYNTYYNTYLYCLE